MIAGNVQYIATQEYDEIYDGTWLIDIDTNVSIRQLVRIPGHKVNVSDQKHSFDCLIEELNVLARILQICKPA